MVLASGSTLMELPGVGPVVAARTLADTGDVARFADRNRYASWTGTAPIEPPPARSYDTGSPGPGTEPPRVQWRVRCGSSAFAGEGCWEA